MTPVLIIHIAAGGIGILSGAAAVSVRKGSHLHRTFGTAFVISMLTMSTIAVYLAAFVSPTAAGAAPPGASMAVAVLTFYLVATAWTTIRRREKGSGLLEYGALVLVLGAVVALVTLGLAAAHSPAGRAGKALVAPYFVFAAFGAFAATLDLTVILRGGIVGVQRIARHLWRMCFALFFASAFFFLGQQKVMPVSIHGSPILFVPALAPLLLMVFWLIRVRLTDRRTPGTGVA